MNVGSDIEMKKKIRQIKRFFNKYINGTKGVISLYLALTMMPFSTLALVLVESARYQHTIQLVDEMLDCIGLSTLADYDSYLEQRFNLLSVSQAKTPTDNFNAYMTANMPALSKSFTCNSSTVGGKFGLGSDDVLRQQIFEYGEVTGPVEALYKGIGVDNLIKQLYDQFSKAKEVKKFADATTAVADTATSVADLIVAIKEAVKAHGSYKTNLTEYKTNAETFRSSAASLISALNTAKANLEEDEELSDIYDKSEVKNAVKACENARDAFKKEASELSSSVTSLRTSFEKIMTSAKKIADNQTKASNAIDGLAASGSGEGEEEGPVATSNETNKWVADIAKEIINVLDMHIKSDYSENMKNQATALSNQAVKIGTVVCNKTADGTAGKYFIDVNSSSTNVNSAFPTLSVTAVGSSFSDDLNALIAKLDSEQSAISSAESVSMGKILDLAAELLNVTFLYDGALDSNVDPAAFHQYNSTDMSFTSYLMINSLTNIVKSGKDFVESLTELNILKALKAVAEYLLAVANFIISIVSWIVETVANLIKFASPDQQIYDTFILSTYCAYNMPCRTTYKAGRAQNGYVYDNIFDMMGGTYGNKVSGSISDLQTIIASPGSGTDPGFKGAELEYLLIGDENELLNQGCAFFNLYMLRMVLNILPILFNAEVKGYMANPGGWAVFIAYLVAEPMLDALFLVNGQSSYLYKKILYLTVQGLPVLVEDMTKLTNLSGNMQSKLNEFAHSKVGTAKGGKLDGVIKMDYVDHMLVLLFISTSQEKIVNRLQNLIQMEAAEYYKTSHTFDLDLANTYVQMIVEGNLNSMFNLEALTKDGPFSIKRNRIVGY